MSGPANGAAAPLDASGAGAAGLTAITPAQPARPGSRVSQAQAGTRGSGARGGGAPGSGDGGSAARGSAARGSGARAGRARGRASGGWPTQLPYAIVLAGVVAGLAWICQGQQHVRAGTLTLAGALFVAALARLTLPRQRAGLLASRRRYIDVTALAILAVGLLVAGLVLPTPS